MKGKNFFTGLILGFVFLSADVSAADDSSAAEQIVSVDGETFAGIAAVKPMERDGAFTDLLKKKISGSGAVLSFDKTKRYGRNLRLLLSGQESSGGKITVIYNIFLDNEETVSMLVTGDEFSFTGKLENVTPCSTGRTVYMLDVIMDDGGKTEKDK